MFLIVLLPLFGLISFSAALCLWTIPRRWKWFIKIPIWCVVCLVCVCTTPVLYFEAQSYEMRGDYLRQCQGNLKMISMGLKAYRADYNGYPQSMNALQPYLGGVGYLHCPRASVLQELSAEHLSGSIPEDYCPDCEIGNGRWTAAQQQALPSDFTYHCPSKSSPGQFVVVEENRYNHALGWSRVSLYRNVLLLNGTIQTRIKPN